MSLNGDIMEYEGYGVVGIEDDIQQDIVGTDVSLEAVELLQLFVNYLWSLYYRNMRLRGGSQNMEFYFPEAYSTPNYYRTLYAEKHKEYKSSQKRKKKVASAVAAGTATVAAAAYPRWKQIGHEKRAERAFKRVQRSWFQRKSEYALEGLETLFYEPEDIPLSKFEEGNFAQYSEILNKEMTDNRYLGKLNMDGREMLEWKNTLTRMYHTYHIYVMSPIKQTATIGTVKVHDTDQGLGPHLYWTFSTTKQSGAKRNETFGRWNYWDGGMDNNPVTTPTYRYYRLGRTGTCYFICANWPGQIMNPDPNTHDQTKVGSLLQWADYIYNQTTTNKNIPRKWVDVFANTTWNYITVYEHKFVFDVQNLYTYDYVLEIHLCKFNADIDAMDYEKMVLAGFGGAQGGVAGAINGLPLSYNNDIIVLKKNKYLIPGNTQMFTEGTTSFATEGDRKTHRRIKFSIKKKDVYKRPVLTSYETNLTEKQIFDKYYEKQSGLYLKIFAYPRKLDMYSDPTGKSDYYGAPDNANPGSTLAEGTCLQGLFVTCYKRSKFKLDETATQF